MALEFMQDAICLSGLTGSRLKCDVIGEYYRLWWSITSGGPRANYDYPTAIVELDAATGEVYVEDTKGDNCRFSRSCHGPQVYWHKHDKLESSPGREGHGLLSPPQKRYQTKMECR